MPNKEFKPLEKITVEPKDDFRNGQIKEALVRIKELKRIIEGLKKEIESLKQRNRLLESYIK